MTTKQVATGKFSEAIWVALSVLTVMTLTVAQSAYEVLAANPQFLSVRRASNPQLLGIILILNLVPALAIFLLSGKNLAFVQASRAKDLYSTFWVLVNTFSAG